MLLEHYRRLSCDRSQTVVGLNSTGAGAMSGLLPFVSPIPFVVSG